VTRLRLTRTIGFVVADYIEYTGDIFVCDRDGGNVRQLTHDPELDDQPAWSPDGTRLVFVSQATIGDRPDLWEMRADGAGARALVDAEVPGGCVSPAFLRRAD
jgi:Tol biopolymer transport system component